MAAQAASVVQRWLHGLRRDVLHKPNPVVQIFYLLLVVGGYGVFLMHGFQQLPNEYLPDWHRFGSFAVVMLALHSFIMASTTHPGLLVPRTLRLFDNYQYDGLLYTDRECPTCKHRKIARSKHCSVCNVCIPRFDHHCIWLNTCVGEQNHWQFLWFLWVNVLLCAYGTYVLFFLLYPDYVRLLADEFVDDATQHVVKGSPKVVLIYLVHSDPLNVILLCLCAFMGLGVGLFFVFHCFLVASNTTTNEFFKRRALRRSKSETTMPAHAYDLFRWWRNVAEVYNPRCADAIDELLKKAQ